ncbi:DUF3987 domain-containing protein [Pseudonocardia acaciae]|uniref:DUF3987 domain-containing protein n=1 Tax=Pseudonocardia acaciae TaxID=551276 RepID=UPI0009FFAB36|nr:DUF3987 domain-containing protein [Pseudonocardia acaciae]
MTSPRPLHAVPSSAPPGTTLGAGVGPARVAEDAARAEVARARRELPQVDDAVWECYLGGLTNGVAETSEADPIGIYTTLLAAAGVYLGQHPHVQAGDDHHPLLVWPMLIGRTGGGRKGASMSAARRLLRAADPGFLATNLRSGLTSGEGLAAIFAEPDDTQTDPDNPAEPDTDRPPARRRGRALLPPGDRRLLVFEPEWAAVMARMRREGNTLSATLRAAWEGGDLSTLNVTARVAPDSHVGLLAHITPEEFRAKLSASDLAGGTYNRFLPIAVARAQFLPLSHGAPADLIDELGASLAKRLQKGAHLGRIGLTAPAAALWRGLYVEFGTDHGDTGPVEQFLARTAPNCLRIAAIHAALDNTPDIEPDHLNAAAALVRYSIASVRTIFSNNGDQRRLLDFITEAGPTGRTRTEITNVCFGKNRTSEDIEPLLDTLEAAGAISRAKRPPGGKGGRPTAVYVAQRYGRNGETDKPP